VKFDIAGAVWLLLAIAVGASGGLAKLRPPAPQLILLAVTLALITADRCSRSFREWNDALDLRAVVALHLTRFVGLYFLVLCRRGELPSEFAMPAGWGDILVATLAVLMLAGWSQFGHKRGVLLAWNTVGLIDILFVVVTAGRVGWRDPNAMAALLRLPLNLLLTFLVPLIIASHLLLFRRVCARGVAAKPRDG
jgi:hypothetical protein